MEKIRINDVDNSVQPAAVMRHHTEWLGLISSLPERARIPRAKVSRSTPVQDSARHRAVQLPS